MENSTNFFFLNPSLSKSDHEISSYECSDGMPHVLRVVVHVEEPNAGGEVPFLNLLDIKDITKQVTLIQVLIMR